MMKIFVLLSFLMGIQVLHAQVQFTVSAKKAGELDYDVRVVATMERPWHIYSQRTPEGGPSPTQIQFAKHPFVRLQGPVQEEGKLVKKYEEVFDMQVLYFEGKVSWVQRVTLAKKIKTKLTGTVRYMLCTDEQCLPPSDYRFSIAID